MCGFAGKVKRVGRRGRKILHHVHAKLLGAGLPLI